MEAGMKKKTHYQKYKTGHKDAFLRRRYGITLNKLKEEKKRQKYLCAICGRKKKLMVDHCHVNKQFRGLLCHNCNCGLGQFKDNPALLEAAIAYLQSSGI